MKLRKMKNETDIQEKFSERREEIARARNILILAL
jgi:hypothetical protein